MDPGAYVITQARPYPHMLPRCLLRILVKEIGGRRLNDYQAPFFGTMLKDLALAKVDNTILGSLISRTHEGIKLF